MKQVIRNATRAILPILLVAASPLAHAQRWYVCSTATLKGTYATIISGQLATPTGPVAISGVAMTELDGEGHVVSNSDHIVRGGTQPPADWRGGSGTYTVNADCTGEMHINSEGGGPPLVLYFVIGKFGAVTRGVVGSPTANITADSVKVEQQ